MADTPAPPPTTPARPYSAALLVATGACLGVALLSFVIAAHATTPAPFLAALLVALVGALATAVASTRIPR